MDSPLTNLPLVLAGLIGAAFAIRGLYRAFTGLLVLMALHFIQPGELVPALDPFRIELVYGVLMLISLVWNKSAVLKELLKSDPIVHATVMLQAVIILTIPFAIWRGGAFEAATEVLKMIILQMLMIVFIDSQDRLRSVLWLLGGFMMWFAGSALLAYTRGEFYEVNGVQRAEGINSMVGGPNELAGFLLALLPFVIVLAVYSKRYIIKIIWMACAGLGFMVLMMTGARIAFLALMAVGISAILRSKRKVLNLAVAIALAMIVWFSLPVQYQQRYMTVGQYAKGGELDDSNKLRLAIWDAGWRMFLDHPVLGVGAGQFPTAYGLVYSGKVHVAWMNPHNLFLQVVCELGILGLCIFAYFLYRIWNTNRWLMKNTDSPPLLLNHMFAVACYYMMIGVGVVSMVSHTLYRPYWYLLAGLVAANRSIVPGENVKWTPKLVPKPEEKVVEELPKVRRSLEEVRAIRRSTRRKVRYF